MHFPNTGNSLTVWYGLKFSFKVYMNIDYSCIMVLVQIKSVESYLPSLTNMSSNYCDSTTPI